MGALKFIYRLLCHLGFWLVVVFPLQLVGVVVLGIALPIIRKTKHMKMGKSLSEQLKLPAFLRWFDNVDIYNGRDYSTYWRVYQEGPWAQYCWLAWRNPLNYFGWQVLGVVNDLGFSLPDDAIGDATGQMPGFRTTEVVLNGTTYYEYYYIRQLTKDKCIRIRVGWKLAGTKQGQIAQWVLVLSFWHSYSGV